MCFNGLIKPSIMYIQINPCHRLVPVEQSMILTVSKSDEPQFRKVSNMLLDKVSWAKMITWKQIPHNRPLGVGWGGGGGGGGIHRSP